MKMQTLDSGEVEIRTLDSRKAHEIMEALDTIEYDYTMRVRTAGASYSLSERLGVTREYVFTVDRKQSSV